MDELADAADQGREIASALVWDATPLPSGTAVTAVRHVSQFSLEMDTFMDVAYVELMASSLQTAVALNGRRNLYNGPRQKLLERRMRESLRRRTPVDSVRLQVTCPTPLEDIDFGPQQSKTIGRVSPSQAVRQGALAANGNVIRLCGDFRLPFLLLRDGHVLGPSPALAEALRVVAPELPTSCRVLDPFAGTDLTASVLARLRPSANVFAADVVDSTGRPTGFDAFTYVPDERFDLVVVDPLYEDVLQYSKQVLPQIRAKLAMVVTGDTSDLAWNAAAMRLLNGLGRVSPRLESVGARLGQNVVLVELHG